MMLITQQTIERLGLTQRTDQAFKKILNLRNSLRDQKITPEETEIQLISIVVFHTKNQNLAEQKSIVSKVLNLISTERKE